MNLILEYLLTKMLVNNPILLASSVYAICIIFIFDFLYSIQPKELIDELFHVNQAKTYCNGSYEKWDPKITTLPGLYIISVGALKLWSLITGKFVCSIYSLRIINCVASVCNFFVIYLINGQLHPKEQKSKSALSALNISTFPVLFFFNFFYYTETISTLLVLMMYLFHLKSRYWSASFVGSFAVFTRQTNIVWISLMLFDFVSTVIDEVDAPTGSQSDHFTSDRTINTLKSTLKKVLHLYLSPYRLGFRGLTFLWKLHWPCIGYVIVILMFIIFVITNGGLVVGDKSAHQAGVNLPQLFYFSFFATTFAIPYFVNRIKFFLKFVTHNILFSVTSIFLFVVIVHFNTVAHPYLLADNRHYVFYIWKKLYERTVAPKYLLTILYFFGLYCIFFCLQNKPIIFKLGYFLSVITSIVPQRLLEYRYFILPFIFFRINIINCSWMQLIEEFYLYVAINFISLYIFASKEFYWSDSTEVQRIIW